jgi:hypothetical protein
LNSRPHPTRECAWSEKLSPECALAQWTIRDWNVQAISPGINPSFSRRQLRCGGFACRDGWRLEGDVRVGINRVLEDIRADISSKKWL